jgi:hypothetical protein
MALNTSYKLYEFKEVSDVEPKHGLYAWYLNMQLSDATTSSSENMVGALRKISEASRYPDLEIQMRGHLSLDLRGKMQHMWYGYDDKYRKELLTILKYPEERVLLQYIFNSAAPLLTSPLYIGISKNLKERLRTHKRLIQEPGRSSSEIINRSTVEDGSETIKQDKTFAQRVIDRDINPNHLIVGVIYVEDINVPQTRIRKTIEAAETLLNRMFHPILGRR